MARGDGSAAKIRPPRLDSTTDAFGFARTSSFENFKAAQTPRTQHLSQSSVGRGGEASPRSALWINQKRTETLTRVLDARVQGRSASSILSPRSVEVLQDYYENKAMEPELKKEYYRSLRGVRAASSHGGGLTVDPDSSYCAKTPRERYVMSHGGTPSKGQVRLDLAQKRVPWRPVVLALGLIVVLLVACFGLPAGAELSVQRGAADAAPPTALVVDDAPLPMRGMRARNASLRSKKSRKQRPRIKSSKDVADEAGLKEIASIAELNAFVKSAREIIVQREMEANADEPEPMHDMVEFSTDT